MSASFHLDLSTQIIDLPNPGSDLLERYRSIVPDWPAFLDALSRPLPLCLWTNTLRTTPEAVRDWLDQEGIEVRPLTWTAAGFKGARSTHSGSPATGGHPANAGPSEPVGPATNAGQNIPFVAGLYHIQEEASCLPVFLLDPQSGERVIDLCAAPGGKSAQIAVAMGNTGTLLSNDRDGVRHRATRGTLDRLGVVNTTITIEDAAAMPGEADLFDRVLADVPCTCEGTSRKNYSAFLNAGPEASRRMGAQQLRILRRAIEMCRPGGRIVYATCTYAPEENESVVDAALSEFGDEIDLLPARIDGFESSPGLTSWEERELDPRLERAMRVWPHQNDTSGFFVAVIRKTLGDQKTALADQEEVLSIQKRAPSRQERTLAGQQRALSRQVRDQSRRQSAPSPPVRLADEKKWIHLLTNRFGIPEAAFEPYMLVRASKKYISIVSRGHLLGGRPHAVSTGMPLIRAQLEYPKLTTAGAMLLGPAATKNTLEVSAEQAAIYTARDEFLLIDGQGERISDTGYVLIRRNGVTLGVALCYLDERRVLSMYPNVLSRAVTDGN